MPIPFLSLTAECPSGFEHRSPTAEELNSGPIVLWARSLPTATVAFEHFAQPCSGLILTAGDSFSHQALTSRLAHLVIPAPLLPHLKQLASAFIQLISTGRQAETALRKSEQRFREFVEGTDNLVTQVDATGNFLYVNHVAQAVFGLSPEECIGRSAFSFIDKRDQERTSQWFAACLQKRVKSASIENRQRHRSGRIRSMSWTVNFHYDAQGNIDHINSIAQDITEHKQSEERLKTAQKRISGILAGTDAGTWDWNIQSGELTVNARWADTFGYTLAELAPISHTTFTDSLHPDDRPRVLALIEKHLSGKLKSYETDFRQRHKNGGWVWVHSRGRIIERSVDGRPLRMSGAHIDISAQKQAEQQLRQLRNYLNSIIDSMPSIIIGVDTQGIVTQWNQEADKATGVSTAEALGQPFEAVFPRLARAQKTIRETLSARRPQQIAKHSYQKNGLTRYEDITIYPLACDDMSGAVIRIDDVTERVRLEEMMIQSEKMLSVGGLAAGMAHEINNPLAGMMQTTSVLGNRILGDMPANQRAAAAAGTTLEAVRAYLKARDVPHMLESIQASGTRAAEIVANMLTFARKGDDSASSHDLGKLLDLCIELAGSDYELKRTYDFRRIEIAREYDPRLPPVPCSSDSFQQVILNILRNGAEAMQGGQPRTSCSWPPRFTLRLSLEDPAQMARIEIEDNGPGMDEEIRKRIFEPFFTTKPVGVGTGLGLSVAYFIVKEYHGGTLSVESAPDQGSKFIIRLPLHGKPSLS